MKREIRGLVFVLVGILLIAGCGQTAKEPHRAFVKNVEKGSATLLRADAKEPVPVEANTLLFAGDTIKTAADTEVVLQFTSGATSRLMSETEFKVEGQQSEKTATDVVFTRLVKGIGYFYVPKGEKGAKKFEVATQRAIASIKGTEFKVEETKEATKLTVGEGTVAFSTTGGQSIDVTALQGATVDANGLQGPFTVNALLDPFLAGGKPTMFDGQTGN